MKVRILTVITSLFCVLTFALSAAPTAQAHSKISYSSSDYNVNLTSQTDPRWGYFTDANGLSSAYSDSNGSYETSQATWYVNSTSSSCSFYVYVPAGKATANISYGFYSNNRWVFAVAINQNNVSGFVYLSYASNINKIELSNNDGQFGTEIGVGLYASMKEVC